MPTLQEVQAKSAPVISRIENKAVRIGATKLVERCYNRGVNIRITHGLRTNEEQASLYAQGRTVPGPIVTKAKPGYSYHNFSLAIDFVLLQGLYDMKYDGDNDGLADWVEVVTEAKKLGFEWGGDWWSFKDYPHFEMNFGLSTAQLRSGVRPTESQMNQAIEIMTKQEEIQMTDTAKALEERQKDIEAKYDEFAKATESRFKALEKKVNITANQTPPAWANDALIAAKRAGAVTTTNDKGHAEIIMLCSMYKMGLFEPGFIELIKQSNQVAEAK